MAKYPLMDAFLVLRQAGGFVPRRRSGIHMTWLEIDLHELQHGSTFDYIEKKKRFKIK